MISVIPSRTPSVIVKYRSTVILTALWNILFDLDKKRIIIIYFYLHGRTVFKRLCSVWDSVTCFYLISCSISCYHLKVSDASDIGQHSLVMHIKCPTFVQGQRTYYIHNIIYIQFNIYHIILYYKILFYLWIKMFKLLDVTRKIAALRASFF